MLLTNQMAVFFDHQYLWKESISRLDFLHGDNHQRKVASESYPFGWVWPVLLLIQSDCIILHKSELSDLWIFWSSICQKRVN